MEMRRLGWTDLQVSLICLGTMTWGQQNTEAEAHQQLDYAWTQGINFLDVAEMYPVPGRPETQGRTEEYIGTWLASRKNREQIILATKVAGPTYMNWIRDGVGPTRASIHAAVDASLKRLQTDTIDLYQIHWPARRTNFFGELGYTHAHVDNAMPPETPIEETLSAMGELVAAGKIRYVGLSNETPWGTMEYLRLAREKSLPRVVSIQNPYSLLNRTFEIGLAEMAIKEQCGLLAYSPLAFGWLSGKYENGARPVGARITEFPVMSRYNNPQSIAATTAYVELARAHGLSPAQMALAYVNSRDFVTSNIIGATTMAQLKENIASADLVLPPDVLTAIEAIHTQHPNPAP